MVVSDWLKKGSSGPNSLTFAACTWRAWHHRNLMCLSNEEWSLHRLVFNIESMVINIKSCFVARHIKWNTENHHCAILNTDGSCLGSPSRAGFGGVIRNSVGFYLLGFPGYIPGTTDILYVELYAIYQGLILASNLGVEDLVCYSDSLHCIQLIKEPTSEYHIYAVLIQDVKDLLEKRNASICHTLREGNQCADFMAKHGASLSNELTYHASPPNGILHLLKANAAGTFFLRE